MLGKVEDLALLVAFIDHGDFGNHRGLGKPPGISLQVTLSVDLKEQVLFWEEMILEITGVEDLCQLVNHFFLCPSIS